MQWLHLIYAAAAYFIAAQLARAVVPNDLAAPLWPASGLALSALLVWGGRCWAGVWLGALVSTLARPYGAVGELDPWTQVTIATLVATAATVQAVAGAHLTHRFLIPAVPLATAGSVLWFLLLAGPVSSVVAASVAVPVLLHYGGLAAGAPYMQWLTWWAGDTMGILLVTPLMLAAASGPRVRRHWRVAQIAIPLLVIGALLATAHFWLDRYERSEAREAAVRDMTQALDIAVSQLPLDIGELYGVERYLASSREVTPGGVRGIHDATARRSEPAGRRVGATCRRAGSTAVRDRCERRAARVIPHLEPPRPPAECAVDRRAWR